MEDLTVRILCTDITFQYQMKFKKPGILRYREEFQFTVLTVVDLQWYLKQKQPNN